MKRSKVETAETRRRIVKSAAAEFRRNGIHATGLSEVMAAAGLTQGGFYRHFGSKAQLVAEACAEGMEWVTQLTEATACPDAGKDGLGTIVESFLALEHRDNLLGGCPLVGLGSELARADDDARAAAMDGFLKLVDLIAKQIPKAKPETARARAIFALSAMIGAVTMSRIVTDAELSTCILEQARKHLAKL
ncbi:MAG TPA: TetR/AcrR family transcriptional regulator [Aliidongia sp.]|nr:TetR/AcrR family transcriptional regulator [Aliidongia sp.]